MQLGISMKLGGSLNGGGRENDVWSRLKTNSRTKRNEASNWEPTSGEYE
jgi:hypothetical protein